MSEPIFLTLASPMVVSRGSSGRLVASARHNIAENSRWAIRQRLAGGMSLRALAKEFGVSHECIRRVLSQDPVLSSRLR